jgi:translation initiation factor IF-2
VKGQLAAIGLQTEDWGGDVVCVEVSALTGHNVDHLVEMLSLEAELLDLKANPKRPATGAVLEAQKTEDRGVVAKLLVQNGTLRKGDVIVAGRAHGRVRSMHDDRGRAVNEAGPATPVELSGLTEVPAAGDKFMVLDDIDTARQIAEERIKREREEAIVERQQVTLEGLFAQMKAGKLKDVKLVVKADVQGSAEVLKQQLASLSTDEVKLNILLVSVGAITQSDVDLAASSQAIVIGFNVDADERVKQMAKERGVDVRTYNVIYQAIDEMKAALEGLLEPEEVEVKTGHLSVKEVFRISRIGAIAGCICTDGKIERAGQVRLIRGGQVAFSGRIEGLKRFKDDVKEVVEGYECGVKLAGHDDIRQGDIIEAFKIEKRPRKLEKK